MSHFWLIAGIELLDCGYRVGLLPLLGMSSCLREASFVHVDVNRTWWKELFISDQYNYEHYQKSIVNKRFYYDHHFLVYYFFWTLFWFWAHVVLQPASLFELGVGSLVSAWCWFSARRDFRTDFNNFCIAFNSFSTFI